MRISVRVTPRSSREGVEQTGAADYKVRVHAAPADGEANDAVIRLLADHFDLSKSRISIVTGHRSRNKLIVVPQLTLGPPVA